MSVGAHVLSTGGLGRESGSVHHDASVADHVLFINVGDHPVDVAGGAAARALSAVYDVSRRALGSPHHRHIERALPQAVHAQDAAVGATLLHPEAAPTAVDARARRVRRLAGALPKKRARPHSRTGDADAALSSIPFFLYPVQPRLCIYCIPGASVLLPKAITDARSAGNFNYTFTTGAARSFD